LDELILDLIRKSLESVFSNSGAWPGFLTAMRLALSGEVQRADPELDSARWALLPGWCCQAAGGDPRSANDLAAAWLLFYTAAHIFDNVEDLDQPEAWWSTLGPGAALNVATGLLFSASLALSQLDHREKTDQAIKEIQLDFYNHLLVMSGGQHRDLLASQPSLNDWLEIAATKSGAFFALACRTGARLATRDPVRLDGFSRFGRSIGILIQILDDLEDFQGLKSQEAPLLPEKIGRSLPLAYAREVLPASLNHQINEKLEIASQDVQAAGEILHLIDASGAPLYILAEIDRQQAQACAGLALAAPEPRAGEILLASLQKLKIE
jgi:geranylgeranyl pyrophosphate synthase